MVKKDIKIGYKIGLLVLVTTIVWLITTMGSNYVGQKAALKSVSQNTLQSYDKVFWELVEQDALAMEKLLTVFVNDEKLVDTFLSGNTDELLNQASPIFKQLKSQFLITHFYFINKKGSVDLRVHNPKKRNDVLKRATFLKAKRSGGVGWGIEMGKEYYSLRVVVPVKRNGDVVGYFELGEELDHLIDGFIKTTGADISMWLGKSYAEDRKVQNKFERQNNWHLVMASNKKNHVKVIKDIGNDIKQDENSFYHVALAGRENNVMAFPFKDASDETAGTILISTDGSVQQALLTDSMYNISVIAVVVTLLSLFGGTWVSQKITAPLRRSVDIANRISRGELNDDVEVSGVGGETNDLLNALTMMTQNLRKIVGRVRESSEGIRNNAGEIAIGNQDLSQRTEEQAASLEETASSMEEMTSTVKQNADSAQQANQLANVARDDAEKGGDVVKKAMSAMKEIDASSNEIANIISVVEDIAFQTNLLALNAAVEAARAGEQGRGFAVVASEVRVLAGRSADAAKEIKTLINDSVDKVKVGSELVDESGQTLTGIVESIKKVADIIAEFDTASQEQFSGIEQVNKTIAQMDDMTQQNATLVNEAASSSKSMENQANDLMDLMGFFKLDRGLNRGHSGQSVNSKPIGESGVTGYLPEIAYEKSA